MSVGEQFARRVQEVPRFGLGLSVDVYSPDLYDLMARFEGSVCRPAYLEIFRATPAALQAVRQSLPNMPLAYHGEGLWITQPEFFRVPLIESELNNVALELKILASPWLNHECATKQMAGYSFGTYLPPLYTPESADLVSEHIALVQERLDSSRAPEAAYGPLFLLEMPPLTYFMAGTISVPEYFRRITRRTPCGLVLDIGHLWTVYRYTIARRQSSFEEFARQFLDEFPMERVVEIHLAGLALHEAQCLGLVCSSRHPEWIDAHAAPIPPMLWTMLEEVLAHPRLEHLRGVALEVDTKSPDLIIEEFFNARRLGPMIEHVMQHNTPTPDVCFESRSSGLQAGGIDRRGLDDAYIRYARIVSGQQPPDGAEWNAVIDDPSGLGRYIQEYLPHEILHWGGKLTDMFPETCKRLHKQGLSLEGFVLWWVRCSRPLDRPYDFFLLKIDRLTEFVMERAPALMELAQREANTLRQAYESANGGSRPLVESCR